jgi:hypothetical protein
MKDPKQRKEAAREMVQKLGLNAAMELIADLGEAFLDASNQKSLGTIDDHRLHLGQMISFGNQDRTITIATGTMAEALRETTRSLADVAAEHSQESRMKVVDPPIADPPIAYPPTGEKYE